MPTRSTAPISAFSPGLAKKAVMICLYSTTSSREHSTRNTSIRTRKIRGEDSLLSSISIAEREEGPDAIGLIATCWEGTFVGINMAQRCREKRPVEGRHSGNRELPG